MDLTQKYDSLLEEITAERAQWEITSAQMKKVIEDKDNEITKLKEEARYLQQEIDNLNLSCTDYIKKNKQLTEQYNKYKRNYMKAQDENQQLQHDIDQEAIVKKSLKDSMQEMMTAVDMQMAKLKSELQEAQQRAEIATKELEEYKIEKQSELKPELVDERLHVERKDNQIPKSNFLYLMLLSIVVHPVFYLIYRTKKR